MNEALNTAMNKQVQPDVTGQMNRPDGLAVPEKFWNPETNEIRIDALLKSYLNLEKQYKALAVRDIPEGPDGYEIHLPSDSITVNSDLNARLHEAGFTREQAQLVYELADEHLQPLVMEMAAHMQSHQHINSLCEEFGGEEKWREISNQISSWGQKHMSEDVFEALASNPEGIRTLYRMMSRNEPDMIDGSTPASGPLSEESIKSIMRDPRYWRDRDPAVVKQVQRGFETLYPSNR